MHRNAARVSNTTLLTRGLFLGLVALFWANSAAAIGLGGYFEYRRGWGEYDSLISCIGSSCFTLPVSGDWDRSTYGGGFLLDTNVAGNRVFNYRLSIGYVGTEETSRLTGTTDLDGLLINNTFGFGVLRTSKVRLFLGPMIGLGFQLPDRTPLFDITGYDFVDLNFGAGAQIGLNFHISDSFSLSVAPAYEYMGLFRFYANPDTTLVGGEHVVSINLGFMWRSPGDQFR